jgi:small subunit ribosomal protein S24e
MKMQLEITKEKETPLLSRKRITADVTFEGKTPSRVDLRNQLSQSIKAPAENIVIRHIYTKFGEQRAKVIAHLYSDVATMVRLESQKVVDKQSGKKAAKKEAA